MRENRFLLVETNLNKPKEPKKKKILIIWFKRGEGYFLRAVVPIFFGTRAWFHGRQFFHRWWEEGMIWDDSSTLSHGQRSLAGYSPQDRKKSDATERLILNKHII